MKEGGREKEMRKNDRRKRNGQKEEGDIAMRQVQSCSFFSSNKFLVKRTIGRFRKREE